MATLNAIRRWTLRDQTFTREIARRMGLVRNTVKKCLRSNRSEPKYPRQPRAGKRYSYAEKLATWRNDTRKSQKQRRTLRQIHTLDPTWRGAKTYPHRGRPLITKRVDQDLRQGLERISAQSRTRDLKQATRLSHALYGLALAGTICAAGSLTQTSPAITPLGAGQLSHDLQRTPARAASPVMDISRMDDIRFLVKSITISGNQALSTDELQLLVVGMSGSERNVRQLNAAIRRITAYYRDRGFAAAKVHLERLDITDGVVSILVAEGCLVDRTLRCRPLAFNQPAGAYLGDIKGGNTMEPRPGAWGLLLLHILRLQR